MGSRQRRIGLVCGALIALAVVTRVTAADSAEKMIDADRSVMYADRVGAPQGYRSAYVTADDLTAELIATNDAGEERQLGLALIAAPITALLPERETYGGIGPSTSYGGPEAIAVRRVALVAVAAESIVASSNDALMLRWRGRELPAGYLDQDPDTGLAALITELDDGMVEEDDFDENVPVVPFRYLPETQGDDQPPWLVIRRDARIRPDTHGFELRRPSPDGETLELDPSLGDRELGAPVVMPFGEGPLPALVGVLVARSSGGSTAIMGADAVLMFLRRVAAIEADPTDDRPYLGIAGRTAADQRILDPDLTPLPGFVVTNVEPDTPADDAGILVDDAIVAVDGMAVRTRTDFLELVRQHRPGDEIRLLTRRGEQRLAVTAILSVTP